ncbi:hypothetical protein SDC9_163800 [bioreactor metagenome]|uniref:Uncharacterized protein n=1 Tax=bioreactor metagenome TaxID=1076179 RepID=A0A645FRW2_9ZZZZ
MLLYREYERESGEGLLPSRKGFQPQQLPVLRLGVYLQPPLERIILVLQLHEGFPSPGEFRIDLPEIAVYALVGLHEEPFLL